MYIQYCSLSFIIIQYYSCQYKSWILHVFFTSDQTLPWRDVDSWADGSATRSPERSPVGHHLLAAPAAARCRGAGGHQRPSASSVRGNSGHHLFKAETSQLRNCMFFFPKVKRKMFGSVWPWRRNWNSAFWKQGFERMESKGFTTWLETFQAKGRWHGLWSLGTLFWMLCQPNIWQWQGQVMNLWSILLRVNTLHLNSLGSFHKAVPHLTQDRRLEMSRWAAVHCDSPKSGLEPHSRSSMSQYLQRAKALPDIYCVCKASSRSSVVWCIPPLG